MTGLVFDQFPLLDRAIVLLPKHSQCVMGLTHILLGDVFVPHFRQKLWDVLSRKSLLTPRGFKVGVVNLELDMRSKFAQICQVSELNPDPHSSHLPGTSFGCVAPQKLHGFPWLPK